MLNSGSYSPWSAQKKKVTSAMGRKGGGDEDVAQEVPLQAVLLADSFTSTFRPISLERPKVHRRRGFRPPRAR